MALDQVEAPHRFRGAHDLSEFPVPTTATRLGELLVRLRELPLESPPWQGGARSRAKPLAVTNQATVFAYFGRFGWSGVRVVRDGNRPSCSLAAKIPANRPFSTCCGISAGTRRKPAGRPRLTRQ